MKQRLDVLMVKRWLAQSRSQAENLIRLGQVMVNGVPVQKAGHFVLETDDISLSSDERYVSRAGLKLASVSQALGLDFQTKTVLDVGSSTGGFTDYALQHGAKKVFAVDVGTEQLHPSLRGNSAIELHEKTDIRDFRPTEPVDIVVMDVSFISLREVLPHIATFCSPTTQVVAMLKPQFEAGRQQINKGIIKNDAIRRQILKDFEAWVRRYFVIQDKKDSEVHGSKGNRERFYLLKIIS
ncbi:TPA: TlyA family rRNA (cytidine-2'-O)-methyltransferase [Candidatus Saccharibacteria bacterium]|nr:TlyA family rRNA (cytidine-2'-O)-methyltransferase [Candidatus Saccharibacteria bacterium]